MCVRLGRGRRRHPPAHARKSDFSAREFGARVTGRRAGQRRLTPRPSVPNGRYGRWRVKQVRPVRIGLVGYGKGGRFFHAPLIAAAAGCELAGVVTRSAERRGELERDLPGTLVYNDLAQLAVAGVDAVTIS